MNGTVPVERTPSRGLLFALIGGYAVAIALAVYGSYRIAPMDRGGFKNFATVAGVATAAVSALMAVIVNLFSLVKGQEAARQLAETNSKLQSLLQKEKFGLDLQLEHKKAMLIAQKLAYSTLLEASEYARQKMMKLGKGSWKAADAESVNVKLSSAAAQAAFLNEKEHQLLWQRIQQRANYIGEKAEGLTTEADQLALWNKESAEFTGMIGEFQKFATQEYQRTPTPGPAPDKR